MDTTTPAQELDLEAKRMLSPEEERLVTIKEAEAAGERIGLENNQVRISGGEILTFGEHSVFDQLEIGKEAGMPLQQLIARDPFRYTALALWRSAVVGGFDKPFDEFAKKLTTTKFKESLAVAKPFLGKGSASERSET